jgi:hypothetical protein
MNVKNRLNIVRTVLVVMLAAATVFLISAPGDGLRVARTVNAAGQATARGATLQFTVNSGTIQWSGTMGTATGTWQGPPERVNGPFQVTAGHGNTIYYWYVRGIAGAQPADEKTMVLATDNWRFQNTTYDRVSDTIAFPDGSGATTRRQGTPAWGVVAVQAPSISEQAEDPARYVNIDLVPSLELADGTIWNMDPVYKANRDWVARTTSLDAGTGDREVTGEPTGANSDAMGRVWEGASNPGAEDPTVTGNTLLSGRPYQGTFVITVPGFTADLQGQSVFLTASTSPTPNTNITLLEGVSTVHDVRLAYGARTGTVENSYTAITYRTASGGFIVDPPDPTPRVLRFAILYVPGDTKFIPDNVGEKSGK